MSRVLLHRPARVLPPAVPTEPVALIPPPAEPPAPPPGSWFQLLLPMMSGVSGMMFMLYNPRPLYIIIGATMAVGSIGMSFAMFYQQRAMVRRKSRSDVLQYRGYLREIAAQARVVAAAQAVGAGFVHPDLAGRWAICRGRVRVWERRPDHPDFVTVRIGTGDVPLATPMGYQPAGEGPFAPGRTELQAEAERMVAEVGRVRDQPILLDLRATPAVSLVGSAERTRMMAVGLVTELATFCAPDDLLVAVCHPKETEDWEFVKWLPHARAGESILALPEGDGFGELLADDLERRRDQARRRTSPFAEQSPDESRRRLLVIVDGYGAAAPVGRLEILGELAERAAALEVSIVFCVEVQRDEPPRVQTRVRVDDDGTFTLESPDGEPTGRMDPPDLALCAAIARRLAPLRLDDPAARTALSETCRLVELLGSPTARHLDVSRMWQALSSPYDVLRVPIGVNGDGQPEVLDLKESAMQGMGPHGLIVGATGSGKSELLRTLVTGLSLTHPPEVLSFVLVDFKGGAAFAGLADLPHVAGMITNLADDLTMVDRMYLALFGEQQRRQKLLRDAGDVDNVREYQRRRAAGLLGDAPPLPYLLIVVDEFGELLAGRPDFIELFVAIGRLGRSLGMHLLLSSQRLEEGRLRGLESHLSYRICLRTFSSVESNVVIGKPDAYHLPPVPGSAYLKVDTTIYERFRAALVSAPDLAPEELTDDTARPGLFTPHGPAPAAVAAVEAVATPMADDERPTEMATAVERVKATGAVPAHQVWLPPLAPGIRLGSLLPPLDRHPRRGLQSRDWPGAGQGTVPVGILDLPGRQAQHPFGVDFTGWAGHLAVVGAPQTGKSTFLRTLLLSAIVTHTPAEMNVYLVDYGGGSLFALAGAPHVGSVGGRLEPDKVRRTVSQIWKLVDERDTRFRELGIDSAETMRERRAAGGLPPEAGADVLLVIDGWGAVRTELEDLDQQILDIAARGQRVGVHLVVTANRWMEIRPQLRDNVGGRLELRLNDPADSQIDRKAAATLPQGVPGRALTAEGDHVQFAVPEFGVSVEEVVSAVAVAWPGPAAPRVRLLPAEVTFGELPGPGEDTRVPIGIDELELAPVYLDLAAADPHFLVLGDAESGKTTFLRSWLAGVQARHKPQEAMFLVIDYRRTLLGAVRQDQTWAYCGAAPAAAAAVKELADGIVERLPPATLTAKVLAERAWWSGPEFYVVVDDYDLVASPSGNPLLPLVDLVAQGHDLGLHVVLARRVGGMARSGFEPLLGRLRELRQPGLVMSGDPGEGPVLGNVRATAQPPGRGVLVRRKQHPVLVQTPRAPLETYGEA
jgi:DNA segregation ATPase FtsK/SpoIIIE, S-DNA-T family